MKSVPGSPFSRRWQEGSGVKSRRCLEIIPNPILKGPETPNAAAAGPSSPFGEGPAVQICQPPGVREEGSLKHGAGSFSRNEAGLSSRGHTPARAFLWVPALR